MLTGRQMAPKAYAEHVKSKLALPVTVAEVELETFEVDVERTSKQIEMAIQQMDRNKAAGADSLHVEMFKSNASKVARSLSICWKS